MRKCSRCGAELPDDRREGDLCPQCRQQAAHAETPAGGTETAEPSPGYAATMRGRPPTIEQIQEIWADSVTADVTPGMTVKPKDRPLPAGGRHKIKPYVLGRAAGGSRRESIPRRSRTTSCWR